MTPAEQPSGSKVRAALWTQPRSTAEPLSSVASSCKVVRSTCRPQSISVPLEEFDDFGFVPNHSVLWTSTIAPERPKASRGLRCRVDLAYVGKACVAAEQLRAVRSFVPREISWWSRGLTFSTNGTRLAYMVGDDVTSRTLHVVDIAAPAAHTSFRAGVTLPLGQSHARVQLSADGLLCAIEREQHIAVLNLFAPKPSLWTVPLCPGQAMEVALFDHQQFCLVTRDAIHRRLWLQGFVHRPKCGFVWEVSSQVQRSHWNVTAQPTTGRLTLWDQEADSLTSFDWGHSAPAGWDHRDSISESFPAILSPLGRYFLLQDKAQSRDLIVVCADETSNDWQYHFGRPAGRWVWRSAVFSPRETHVAVLFDAQPNAQMRHASAGACVFDLQAPHRAPQYFMYNCEVARVQFSFEGDRLAVLYRSVRGHSQLTKAAFRLHVWPLNHSNFVAQVSAKSYGPCD